MSLRVWHGPSIRVACLVHVCDMSEQQNYAILKCVCVILCVCVIWLVEMWGMSHSYVWHDFYVCGITHPYICDVTEYAKMYLRWLGRWLVESLWHARVFWVSNVRCVMKCTLQHTVTHCNTMQHTAIHCNTLQHTATHCNTLHHAVFWASNVRCVMKCTLQHTATHCNTLQHSSAHCTTQYFERHMFVMWWNAHCNTLQHTATHCNTLRHIASHYNTLVFSASHVWRVMESDRYKESIYIYKQLWFSLIIGYW